MDTITSPANPRVKRLVALRRARTRRDEGVTLVEGFEEISIALDGGVVPAVLYVCRELWSPSGYAGQQLIGHQEDLLARAADRGAAVVALSRAAFEKAAYREGADGLLAEVRTPSGDLASLVLAPEPLLLLAESVEKPGNLGAMLRTADAAGVDAVVAVDEVTDWGNPNVVRASKGTVFTVPVASGTAAQTLAWSQARGIRLIVTTPETDVLHTDISYAGPVAVVVGSEKHGASDALLEAAAYRVRIPMHGKANSLNVGVSAAIVLYEAIRQRGGNRLHR